MAKRAKASEPSEPEREAGIVLADDPARSDDPPPEAQAKSTSPPAPAQAPPRTVSDLSFGERIGRFFRFLLRLVLLLIFLGLLSVALYLALPWFYQRFIRPVEQNTAQVRELQSRQEQTEQELADLQETLEAGQNQNGDSFTELDQRLSEVEAEINARTESLESLEQMLSDLEGQNEANAVELERQINILKAMELLSRARLSMYQSNFGLAKQDVQIARDLLTGIEPDTSTSQAEELSTVVLRLDMTLSNLPNFPVAASDDLDIAWQILLSGLPEGTPSVSVTSTQAGTASPTPAAADVTITPTPQETVQPSATP